ncbi:MAG: ABC transporter transmembrane domain-containing protein, partial [Candidatus Sericytochromatia bacterium]
MQLNQPIINTPDVSIKETIIWLWRFWGNLKGAAYFLVLSTPLAMFLRAYPPIIISQIVNELSKTNTSTLAVNNLAFEIIYNPLNITPEYLENNFQLLNSGIANGDYVKERIFLFLVLGTLNLFSYIFIQSFRGIMNYNLENAFRLSVFSYIIKLGQSFFQKFEAGDLTTRLIDDVSEKKLAWFACSGIFRTYEGVLAVLISLYFMYSLSPELTIVSFIPLASILTMYIFVSRKTTEYSKRTQEAVSKLNSFLTSTFDGIKIVKSYSQEKNQENYFDSVVENQRNKEIELVKVSSLLELTYTRIAEAVIIFVFMFGGWLAINNKIQLGTVIAFNSYIFMLIWPMVDIGQFFLKGRSASVSVGRIKELENFEPDIVNKENPISLQGKKLNWSFKNISYV